VTIEQQQRCLEPSGVDLRLEPHNARVHGTTTNVARLTLDATPIPGDGPLTIELDGTTFDDVARPAPGRLTFRRSGDGWIRAATHGSPPSEKGPRRSGPFKRAFENRVLFVYGTHGNPAENRWAQRRARYDAETWWYRGNGSIDVYPDTAFDRTAHPGRSVICYGNATTNTALALLTAGAPFAVTGASLTLGTKRVSERDDTAMLAIYPRTGTTAALVGIIGGTGIRGMRATDFLPIFGSGVAYPDLTVFDASVRTEGLAAIRVTGYFGNDWSVERGEWAWRK
jgi:hypothetical protein